MHPELCKELVEMQLTEALSASGLFDERLNLIEDTPPVLYFGFKNKHDRRRVLRFDWSNYDFQAMQIEPVDPDTHELLPPDHWMLRNGTAFPPLAIKGGRPFLCFPGNRDYYQHESHLPHVTGERWERWRSELKLRDVLRYIKDKFSRGDWE